MNRTVLSLKPRRQYMILLAEINRDVDTITKEAKSVFDSGTLDPVVTEQQLEVLEQTYRRLLSAQQEINELYLVGGEHFDKTAESDAPLGHGWGDR